MADERLKVELLEAREGDLLSRGRQGAEEVDGVQPARQEGL